MWSNDLSERVSHVEAQLTIISSSIDDIKKKLENLEISKMMTKIALLEQKLSIVQWVWWLLLSWVLLYIVSWIMKII